MAPICYGAKTEVGFRKRILWCQNPAGCGLAGADIRSPVPTYLLLQHCTTGLRSDLGWQSGACARHSTCAPSIPSPHAHSRHMLMRACTHSLLRAVAARAARPKHRLLWQSEGLGRAYGQHLRQWAVGGGGVRGPAPSAAATWFETADAFVCQWAAAGNLL
eukprot:1161182-Pelagomonas_calceolata.AAC.9